MDNILRVLVKRLCTLALEILDYLNDTELKNLELQEQNTLINFNDLLVKDVDSIKK